MIVKGHWNNSKNRRFGGFTIEENKLIESLMIKPIVNLFSGSSILGTVRVDLLTEEATVKMDAIDYLLTCKDNSIRTIICDPPYNEKNTKKYGSVGRNYTGNTVNLTLLKKEINRVLAVGGYVFFKHWFDFAPGSNFQLIDEIVTKYGGYRRITILTCYQKYFLKEGKN